MSAEEPQGSLDAGAPEVPVFARAILIAHQRDAIAYLDMRVADLAEAGKDDDAAFWSAVRIEGQRQIDAGEWHPVS